MNTKLEQLMNLIIEADKDEGKEVREEGVISSMAKFIESLDDDVLDDKSDESIANAFESLLDVIISLDEEELDDTSMDLLDNVMSTIDGLETVDVDESVSKYKKRKVSSGRKRSSAGRLQGSDKRNYIKRLKDKKKQYKASFSKRLKAKKAQKKYKKTSKAKAVSRKYKQVNKNKK